MNEEVNNLNELDSNSSPEQPIQPTEPKIDNLGRSYLYHYFPNEPNLILAVS